MRIPKIRKKPPNIGAPLKSSRPEIAPMSMDGHLNKIYSNIENPNMSEKSSYSPEKHDFSEISSGRTNKMGEGKNGPSHCPLPKVVVRSEAKSLKLWANKHKQQKIPIPHDLKLAYLDLKMILSDPLSSSSLQLELANQLAETYKKHKAVGSERTYEKLCQQVVTLQDYIEYKNELIEEPPFNIGCENYDIKVVPTTADEILAALDQHPLSDAYERFLFDSIVHSAFVSDSKGNPEDLESLVQEAMTAALLHLHSISEYSIMPSPVIKSDPEETIYTEASAHESSTKINEEYDLPIVTLPVIDSLCSYYLSTKPLYLTPIGNTIPDGCNLLTALLFPDSVYPTNKPTIIYTIYQPSPPDSFLLNQGVVEEAMPIYYEEDIGDDNDTDPSLLEDCVLLHLGQETPVLPGSEDVYVEESAVSLINNSSFSVSPSSLVEATMGDRKVAVFFNTYAPPTEVFSPPPPQQNVAAWWESWKSASNLISDDYTPSDDLNSPPPPQLMVAAWWDGWKHSTTTLQREPIKSRVIPHPSHQVSILAAWWEGWKHSTTTVQRESIKSRVIPHPSHQVSILDAWWEGWKVSTTPQLVISSSCIILFYLLLLYYILSKSLLYNVPPAVYDLTNTYNLPFPHHYPIPTGSMGGWVKVPDHYSSIPRAPPWKHRPGSWPTQDSTIFQVIRRIIEKIKQPIPTFYPTQFKPKNPNPGSRVLSMAFQDPVRIFDPG